MLRSLRVKNLALIREAEVETGPGLNVISGETGAGKSLLLGSVNLAMGARAGKDLFGDDSRDLLAELFFDQVPDDLKALLADHDICVEDELILTRKITAAGRSVCRINAETVSAAFLREVASRLIQVHGQREHELLRDQKVHLRFLDTWAKNELGDRPDRLREAYQRMAGANRAVQEAQAREEGAGRELSFLQFEVEEIEAARLIPGEEEALEARYRTMSHGQKIVEALSLCRDLTGSGQAGAADQIGRAARSLKDVVAYEERVGQLSDRLSEIENLLSDFNQDTADLIDDMEFGQEDFYQVESRLNTIHHLQSKYGNDISQILDQQKKRQERIEQLLDYDAYLESLRKEAREATRAYRALAGEVHDIRLKAAESLSAAMEESLQDLNFPQVVFESRLTEADQPAADGIDQVRFLISTNPGEAVKPLDLVASGGELSRIMLAFRTLLAGSDAVETLIFDEIDSGISGRTAQKVGEKMRAASAGHQIICITHLPQIAAMADRHFLIEKQADEGQTQTKVRTLDTGDSVLELARMLGGAKITDAVLENAREMKQLAQKGEGL